MGFGEVVGGGGGGLRGYSKLLTLRTTRLSSSPEYQVGSRQVLSGGASI